MRFSSRTILIFLLVTSTCGLLLAQSPARPVKKSSVTGKVTIKGKGVPGIAVGLRISDFSAMTIDSSYKGITDEDGVFHINDVAPGTYQLMPLAPAYVSVGEANRAKILVIGEGEAVDDADISLVRGGVITGKVTDADGRPVIEMRVNLLPADRPPGAVNPRTPPLTNTSTDDRGIYRIYGLAAGRYKVSVGQSQSSFITNYSGRPIYKETFYPDTTDQAKATAVEVTEGSESSNIDIVAGRATQTFAMTGRVINGENSEPVGGLRFGLRLMTNGQPVAVNTSALSDARGQFRVENLAPGKYSLYIMPQINNPSSSDPVTFEIIDQDLTDVLVKTSKGVSVAGIVVLENPEDKRAYADLLKLRLQGYVPSGDQGGMGNATTINGDGSFLLTGLRAGTVYFSLSSFTDLNLLKSFHLRRVERDGVIQPSGVEVKTGDQVTGIRLVVAYGTATLRGTVTTVNGTLPANGRISLRLTLSGEVNSSFRPPEIDSRGHFALEGLPAGQYELTAVVFVPGSRAETARTTRQISITEGMVTDVQLIIDLGQTPQ